MPPQHMSRTVAKTGTMMRRPRMAMGSRHLNILRISLIMGIFWDNVGYVLLTISLWSAMLNTRSVVGRTWGEHVTEKRRMQTTVERLEALPPRERNIILDIIDLLLDRVEDDPTDHQTVSARTQARRARPNDPLR